MPGALLRTALSTDMRMSCSLEDNEHQTQRFQVHSRSLDWRNRHEIQPQESPSLPTCLFSLLSDPGTHAGRFRGGPVYEAWCPEWKLNLCHADLAKSIQCTSTMFLSHRIEHSPEH